MAKNRRLGVKKPTNKGEVRKLLLERKEAVKTNSDLLKSDRWTLQDVWYFVAPIIKKISGLVLTDRKIILSYIKDIVEGEFKMKRHELGIIAAARAEFSFRGKVTGVGFNEIKKLAKEGTDVIIIEKEGIVEVLEPYAEKYGIALMLVF